MEVYKIKLRKVSSPESRSLLLSECQFSPLQYKGSPELLIYFQVLYCTVMYRKPRAFDRLPCLILYCKYFRSLNIRETESFWSSSMPYTVLQVFRKLKNVTRFSFSDALLSEITILRNFLQLMYIISDFYLSKFFFCTFLRFEDNLNNVKTHRLHRAIKN